MSGKNQSPIIFNWFTTNPSLTLLPLAVNQSQYPLSGGVQSGVMTGTSTIYSQIFDVSRMDNCGLEVSWTGTPTGTFAVFYSNSGINFYSLTFTPALAQPSGSAGGYLVNVNQEPFKWMQLQYTNTSGTGALTVYGQIKDLN
jgi:hypothetical protein